MTNNYYLWRFLDFTKFVDLLDKRALFFCRTDQFEDPYEGSYPEKFFPREKDIAKLYKDGSNHPPVFCNPEQRKKLREYVAINCWHMNKYESAAMWKLYLKSDEGVAIRTSNVRLNRSFKDVRKTLATDNLELVGLAHVQYVDFQEDDPKLGEMGAFRLKRRSFEHEREARVIIWRNKDKSIDDLEPIPSCGLIVQVDIETLIEKIYVSPTASRWFVELVRSVMTNYGIRCQVIQSAIYENSALF